MVCCRFNADAAANPQDSRAVHLDDNLRRANLQVCAQTGSWGPAWLGRLQDRTAALAGGTGYRQHQLSGSVHRQIAGGCVCRIVLIVVAVVVAVLWLFCTGAHPC
jgi:hypothetical protein